MSGPEDGSSWALLSGLVCRSAVCVDACNPAWEGWGVHHHSVPSVVLGLAGRSQVDIADGRILVLAPGDLVLVQPWVWHIDRRPLDAGITLITGHIGALADVELSRADGRWIGETPWRGLDVRIAALARAATAERRRSAGQALIDELSRRAPTPRRVPPALSRMAGHAWRLRTQPITAREVLAASGLSYSVAHDLFVRHFAETPKQYLLRTRLSLAQHLLRGGRPLAAVWREAGFASRPDLTRRFRLAFGLPPLAWQRRVRSGLSRP